MKWLAKQKLQPQPNLGDRRMVMKFAFFPHKVLHRVDETWWVWLERYGVMEQYVEVPKPTKNGMVTRREWVPKYESVSFLK